MEKELTLIARFQDNLQKMERLEQFVNQEELSLSPEDVAFVGFETDLDPDGYDGDEEALEEIEDIEDFEVLTESTSSGSKNYYIQGPFMQWGVPNRNGRLYPKDVMESAVGKYVGELVSKNRAVGTLGHEDSPKISENKISHLITELKFDEIGRAHV